MAMRLLGAAIAGGVLALAAERMLRRLYAAVLRPRTVPVKDCGDVAVSFERSGGNTLVTLDWTKVFGTLPFKVPFCSAVLTDDGTIYVSGTIGLAPPASDGGPPSIVAGGPKAEMIRTMEIAEAFLKACGASVENITMAHCYLVDNTKERFAEMNAG